MIEVGVEIGRVHLVISELLLDAEAGVVAVEEETRLRESLVTFRVDDKTKAVAKAICDLNPDFVSVTYGAGGGTSQQTVEIARYINETGNTALAHITCASSNRQEVAEAQQDVRCK